MSDKYSDSAQKAWGGVGLGPKIASEPRQESILEFLKVQRVKIDANQKEAMRNAFTWQSHADIDAQRLRELNIAIAALEAPAQPLDELRSTEDAQVEPDFISWTGGECPFDADVVVDVVLGSGAVIKYNRADFWHRESWLHEPGYVHIIGYRVSQNVLPGGVEESRDQINIPADVYNHTLDRLTERLANLVANPNAPLIDAQTTDPVDPRVEGDWTPTVQPAEITVADLDNLATKASPEERAEIEGQGALAEFMKLPGAVKWDGGECPVPQSAVVEYLLRGADLPPLDPKPAFLLSWDHADILGDIIAYRVVSEPAEQYDDPTAVAIAAYIEAENEAPAPEHGNETPLEAYDRGFHMGDCGEPFHGGCAHEAFWGGYDAGRRGCQFEDVRQQVTWEPQAREHRDMWISPAPDPSPYDAAVEKGAITQSEADLLEAAKAEQARFFAEGMMADADKHAKHDGPFAWLRKREDA